MTKTTFIKERDLRVMRELYPELSFELKSEPNEGGAYVANILDRARRRYTTAEAEEAIQDADNFSLMSEARRDPKAFAKTYGYRR